MMKKQPVLSFPVVLLLSLLYSTTTLAQLSPASAPLKPSQPTPTPPAKAPKQPLVPSLPESPSDATPDTAAVDIVGILRQAKSFNILIRLMKTTQLINQLNAQLLTTKSGGITLLAPDDSSFSELKAGFLNSLSDGQKLELLQFHVLSDYVSSSNFDTLTNPVRTLAGSKPGKVELNVNISTGEVNTTITGIVYTDKHLAIYKVGKVLLPMDFFVVAKAPSLAPESPAKAPKADKEKSMSPDSSESSDINSNNGTSGTVKISHGKLLSLVPGLVLLIALLS
ncbi:hypothetical protein ACSQ67_022612 [Phaseolus vulgaris]